MRVLCCNDDGHTAPGLRVLADAARAVAEDVWTVGPERKWTAASHHLTFDRDLVLTRTGERSYACSGTPADGVIAAMSLLFADDGPDLVLAGVNDKRNVAEDIAYSGTMAIAREATFWNVPAIALSGEGWGTRGASEAATLARLIDALWGTRAEWAADGAWLSVNLPDALPAPIACARVGRDKIAGACDVVDATGERIVYRLRRGRPGTRTDGDENALLAQGSVSVVRFRWQSDVALPPPLVARWQRLIGDGA
jgi:5'-nucleotidase